MWWTIWLARNNSIFNDPRPISHVVAIKSLSLFVELSGLVLSSLSVTLWRSSSIQAVGNLLKFSKPVSIPSWRLRGSNEDFNFFWMKSPSAVIFFDDAYKGNPGVSRVGGLVYSPDRLSSIRFSWGLGTMSNNQAKGYTLLFASHLVLKKGYKSVHIFGDLEILIKSLNSANRINNSALNIIL